MLTYDDTSNKADFLSDTGTAMESLLQFTDFCDGCHERVSACLRRNRVLYRANQLLVEENQVPLSLFPKAIHKLLASDNKKNQDSTTSTVGATAAFDLLHRAIVFKASSKN